MPVDLPESFVNWRTGSWRPTRRYATLEQALAEAKRLRSLEPEAAFYTFKLPLMREGGQ